MQGVFRYPRFASRRAPELDQAATRCVPVVVVGAGPAGLTAAIDLAQHGIAVLLLDDDDTVSAGSRGVSYARRSLEILDRLGCGEAVAAMGVSWNVARTFFRDAEIQRTELLPQEGYAHSGMINLPQYHLESRLVERARELPALEIRWKNRVVDVDYRGDCVTLVIETPDGPYALQAQWLIAADGARSTVRRMCGLDVAGQVFFDRFLIADIVMNSELPAERRFWFDPSFHRGQSVLLHKQPENLWRVDFQLGWDADPEEERKPERVTARIRAMLGPGHAFELDWVSVYTFQCRRMRGFRHGRLLFIGDAAHQVLSFGARGGNSGIQDADNLAWKLAMVIEGSADETLLDSYVDERLHAADENILSSTRATDFITPKSHASRLFRDAVLALAGKQPFARTLVNSGRLSVPAILHDSPLNTPDLDVFEGRMRPGTPADDAPVLDPYGRGWLLDSLGGRFVALHYVDGAAAVDAPVVRAIARLSREEVPVDVVLVSATPPPNHDGSRSESSAPAIGSERVLVDHTGLVAQRYDARPGTTYLIRPDQHVCARFRRFDVALIRDALARATARPVHEFAP